MNIATLCISGLGRLLNRIGHRLVRWGYALEMRAWRRVAIARKEEQK